jgi:5,10-methylene-tetrahydrofolate dehydrogenase/methenyl tetrahydrofolate cyclohydrolase
MAPLCNIEHKQNSIITSINVEKDFDKMEQLFMIKVLKKLVMGETPT